MKSLIPAVSLLSLLAFAGVSACDGGGSNSPSTVSVKSEELKPGGVYIAYMNSCGCTGCDQLAKGDLILEFDGTPVTDAPRTCAPAGSPTVSPAQAQGPQEGRRRSPR